MAESLLGWRNLVARLYGHLRREFAEKAAEKLTFQAIDDLEGG